MFDSKFHGHQLMKLQLSYEIMFGYVHKLQIAHLIPLKIINMVSCNRFSKPAGPGRFLTDTAILVLKNRFSVSFTCPFLHNSIGRSTDVCKPFSMAWLCLSFELNDSLIFVKIHLYTV